MAEENDMQEAEFWLEYMVSHYMAQEHTWEWAFFVGFDGEIVVRHGHGWQETGVYCTRRTIKGCVWE